MPGDENTLPRRQIRVELGADFFRALPQSGDRPLSLCGSRQHTERLDLLQQNADGFFEFQ
jgi:hypothetical protein